MGPQAILPTVELHNSFETLTDEGELYSNDTSVDQSHKKLNDNVSIQPKVINLSKVALNKDEINLLKKGPKFTPTPKQNSESLKEDVHSFCRKLRLREFFSETDVENDDDSIAKNKSKFTPQRNRNTTLDTYVDFLKKTAENIGSQEIKPKCNINANEWRCLQKLNNNPDLIIKQADKGGAFVIMDADFYADKMLDHLKDEETYEKLEGNIDEKVKKKMMQLINNHAKCFTKKEQDFLTKFEQKTSNMYGLPKIHQSSAIEHEVKKSNSEYINCQAPKELKMRPIIAGPVSPTQRLSNFIDILLKPLVSYVTSFVRDDFDFLTHLPEKLPLESVFVTYDVNSLYTNIPHDEGLKSIEFWIDKYPNTINSRFSKEFILDAIKFILNNNTFHFDDNHYVQKRGTAMGTKMAPTYATLFMGYLEKKLYEKIESQFDINTRRYFEKNWLRYLDDCFIVWKTDFGDINELHSILNNLHPSISFKWSVSTTSINFLDITLIKEGDLLKTDIFYKITDTHQYLHFKSCHPKQCKNNVPYNLARRICTIVSDEETKKARLNELKNMLLARHYPKQIIETGIVKANALSREELLTKKTKEENEIIPFVHTFNPNNPNMFQIIHDSMPIIKTDEALKTAFKGTKLISSKRQSPNLKQILTKASFSRNTKSEGGVKKCGDKRCKTCPYLDVTNKLEIGNNEKKFTFYIKFPFTCKTKNLLYCITCQGCQEQYIGETGDILRNRVRVHRQKIRQKEYRQIKLSEHLDTCARSIDPCFLITPFYKMNDDDKVKRCLKEEFFIKKFKPSLNAI